MNNSHAKRCTTLKLGAIKRLCKSFNSDELRPFRFNRRGIITFYAKTYFTHAKNHRSRFISDREEEFHFKVKGESSTEDARKSLTTSFLRICSLDHRPMTIHEALTLDDVGLRIHYSIADACRRFSFVGFRCVFLCFNWKWHGRRVEFFLGWIRKSSTRSMSRLDSEGLDALQKIADEHLKREKNRFKI